MTKESVHDVAVERILQNPGLIGLDDVVMSVEGFITSQTGCIGQMDGLFFTKQGSLYLMEYKSGDCPEKAREQLQRMRPYIQRATGMRPWLLYVSGKEGNGDYRVMYVT